MLFPKGTWARRDFPGTKFNFTPAWFAQVKANWLADGSPALPLDYNHEDDNIAAGWITDLDVRPDGLYGLTKWNEPALEHIKADEYRYLSPSWAFNSKDRQTSSDQGPELFGAALLNDPFFNEMPRVAAAHKPPAAHVEDTMNKKFVAALLQHHGHDVNESDSDDTINSALSKACDSVKSSKATDLQDQKVKAAVEPIKGALADATKQLAAAAEENKTYAARIAALETAKVDAELDAVIKELIAGDHIVSANADKVKAYAKATSVAEAKTLFSTFKAHKMGGPELGRAGDPTDVTTPEGAHVKLEALVNEMAKAEKITHSEARDRVMASAANAPLLAAASKLIGVSKPN